jgi:hypothetical protein
MNKEIQISAIVSQSTKDMLDRHVRASGVKKGHLIEQALRHHLLALEQLPANFIIHPKVVVSRKSGEAILKQVDTATPTKALRELMRNGD